MSPPEDSLRAVITQSGQMVRVVYQEVFRYTTCNMEHLHVLGTSFFCFLLTLKKSRLITKVLVPYFLIFMIGKMKF